MAEVEAPDWHRVVHLAGVDDTGDRQWVLLDSAGRIIAVIQGELEGITGNVNVDQTEKDREIQGADGATLRTVKVDASGQIIMVPRGQSGNYMLVDASGYLSTLIKGDDSGTPRTVAVDGSGNIVAVTKGDYSGSLQTIAVDASGRMIMIPTDPADVWGNAIQMGIAELASVLTPCKRFDRRGNVVFQDSFEGGFNKWYGNTTGAGGGVGLAAERAWWGDYSLRMTTPVQAGGFSWISKVFQPTILEKIGIEVGYNVDDDPPEVWIYISRYDGTNYHLWIIKHDTDASELFYRSSGAAWVRFATDAYCDTSFYAWHTLKLVLDLSNNEYLRVLYNNQEYDLEGLASQSIASATTPRISVVFEIWGDDVANYDVFLDNIILTQNEPPN